MTTFDECIKEILLNDFELFPKKGDFSFLKDGFMKNALTFDYQIFNNNCDLNPDILKYICYPLHTNKTFYKSINVLKYILENGWVEFTIKYNNLI